MFANVVLVDEINRTPPRTQSALLEPMEERQVTVEGTTHALPEPYVVIATENPVEQHGTYPLPKASSIGSRSSVRIGYPDTDGVDRRRPAAARPSSACATSTSCCVPTRWLRAQHAVRSVFVDDAVLRYAVDLVGATRDAPSVALGASPRASVALVRCAQARAVAHARDHVLPDDVKALAVAALAHRLVMHARRAPRPPGRRSSGCSTRCRFRCTSPGAGEPVRPRKRAAGLVLGAPSCS